MKSYRSIIVIGLAFATTFVFVSTRPTQAMPPFAQAYGMNCDVCHTAVPALNAYGRYVQRTGYASLDPADFSRQVLAARPADLAVLAIHGSAQMAHSFGALAERLAPRHRFVGVDLRGHGFSDKPPSGYDVDRHVDDLGQLLEGLALRAPVILGHSAGGMIAACLAARGAAAGLILLEAMIGDRAFVENAAAQAAPLAQSLGLPVAGFDTYLDTWRARWGPITDEAERIAERWARFALAPMPDGRYRERAVRAAVEAEWASIIAADSLGTLARVTCPVLIVQAPRPWIGGRPYFTKSIVEAQVRAARGAEVFVARRSDHATMIRDPEPAMVEAISRFISRCRTAPASAPPAITGARRPAPARCLDPPGRPD